jgi:large subunit ribosomal protein L9
MRGETGRKSGVYTEIHEHFSPGFNEAGRPSAQLNKVELVSYEVIEMDVILLEKVHRLGDLGDRVKVKPGYGRNYLIPTRRAVSATDSNVAKFEAQRAELAKVQAAKLTEAQSRATALSGVTVSIASKAGSEGRLYGSVGTADIAAAVNAMGIAIEKKEVRMPNGPLREIGEHQVDLHLHPDVNASIKVAVVAEEETAG